MRTLWKHLQLTGLYTLLHCSLLYCGVLDQLDIFGMGSGTLGTGSAWGEFSENSSNPAPPSPQPYAGMLMMSWNHPWRVNQLLHSRFSYTPASAFWKTGAISWFGSVTASFTRLDSVYRNYSLAPQLYLAFASARTKKRSRKQLGLSAGWRPTFYRTDYQGYMNNWTAFSHSGGFTGSFYDQADSDVAPKAVAGFFWQGAPASEFFRFSPEKDRFVLGISLKCSDLFRLGVKWEKNRHSSERFYFSQSLYLGKYLAIRQGLGISPGIWAMSVELNPSWGKAWTSVVFHPDLGFSPGAGAGYRVSKRESTLATE